MINDYFGLFGLYIINCKMWIGIGMYLGIWNVYYEWLFGIVYYEYVVIVIMNEYFEWIGIVFVIVIVNDYELWMNILNVLELCLWLWMIMNNDYFGMYIMNDYFECILWNKNEIFWMYCNYEYF